MTEKTEQTPPATEQTPAKTEAKTEQTPPATQQTQTQAPAGGSKDPAPKAEAKDKEAVVGADDAIPEGAERVRMPKKALNERLASASKSELKALFAEFGVENKEGLKAKLDKLKAAEDKEEADRMNALSREERLEEEKAKAEAKAQEWQTKFEQRVANEEIQKAQTHTSKLLSELIDPDYIDVELQKLAQHLVTKYTDKELEDLPDSVIQDWAKERVKAKPKLAKDFAAPPPPAEKKPLSTTGKNDDPPPGKGTEGPKDFRPPKGETPEQRRQVMADIKKQHGYSF